jgi:uncharacterized membrane protein YidH (DUF202 family)
VGGEAIEDGEENVISIRSSILKEMWFHWFGIQLRRLYVTLMRFSKDSCNFCEITFSIIIIFLVLLLCVLHFSFDKWQNTSQIRRTRKRKKSEVAQFSIWVLKIFNNVNVSLVHLINTILCLTKKKEINNVNLLYFMRILYSKCSLWLLFRILLLYICNFAFFFFVVGFFYYFGYTLYFILLTFLFIYNLFIILTKKKPCRTRYINT